MLPYGCEIEIVTTLCAGSVGADSISARAALRKRKLPGGGKTPPYKATINFDAAACCRGRCLHRPAGAHCAPLHNFIPISV